MIKKLFPAPKVYLLLELEQLSLKGLAITSLSQNKLPFFYAAGGLASFLTMVGDT